MMKLSEAIALGSLVVKPQPGVVLTRFLGKDYGCAIGMACKAANVPREKFLEAWPWTIGYANAAPCRCLFRPAPQIAVLIGHLFDYHVCGHRAIGREGCDWTLDQLIAWVKTQEPEEVDRPATSTAQEFRVADPAEPVSSDAS